MPSGFRWVGRAPTQQVFSRKIQRLNQAARDELAGIGGRMIATATVLSSGPFSLKELAALGHPYSRRHPKLALIGGRPEVINIQTGEYHAGWRYTIWKRHGVTSLRLKNLAPHAKWLPPSVKYWGASRMVVRPIFRAIMTAIRSYKDAAVKRAIRRGLRTR